jgi:hypothetical protein
VIGSSDRYRGVLGLIALSGLRVGEVLDVIRLYHYDAEGYLNRELMVLEHIKYPALFIRKAKKAYITVIDDYMLELSIMRRFESNHCLNRFRKIWAYGHEAQGHGPEDLELLQGMTPRDIFLRYYYNPTSIPSSARLGRP